MRILGAVLGAVSTVALAQTAPLAVTPDNFRRAETDSHFASLAKRGGLGNFLHRREPTPDTLHSEAVFDLDAGPVTITLADAGKRFLSLTMIDQDHYVRGVFYGKGSHTLDRRRIGTRYAFAALRVFADPGSEADMKQARALQDAATIKSKSSGKLELPIWDPVSQKKVREALLALGATLPDLHRAFGAKDQVDPVRHLVGTALAWGASPDKDVFTISIAPVLNDGKVVYRLQVPANVPVDAFWSVAAGGGSVNSLTAKKAEDGSVAIQFGRCAGTPNCLQTTSGWSYTVRLYRPRSEVLEGKWQFPAAVQRGDGLGRGLRG